jgi:uncharacterized repeat protein (TIGR01451 family)
MAYVSATGLRGIYAIEGESGTGFTRYITTEPVADLSVSAAASASSVKLGAEASYTLHVANGGPNEAKATLSDLLPANVSFVSATASQGGCSGTLTVSCALGGLASGGVCHGDDHREGYGGRDGDRQCDRFRGRCGPQLSQQQRHGLGDGRSAARRMQERQGCDDPLENRPEAPPAAHRRDGQRHAGSPPEGKGTQGDRRPRRPWPGHVCGEDHR